MPVGTTLFSDLPNATTTDDGLMAAADKSKLDGMPAAGAGQKFATADTHGATGTHSAASISVAPTATLLSNTVQEALEELDAELQAIPGATEVAANTVMAGPASGDPAVPAARALVDADIPVAVARTTAVTTAIGSAITTHNGDTTAHGQTAVGRAVLTAADAAAARAAIGAGVGGGDMVAANNLSELTASAATARTNIGAAAASALATEITDRTNADTALSGRITTLETAPAVPQRRSMGWRFKAAPSAGDMQGGVYTLDEDVNIVGTRAYAETAPSGGAATLDIEYKRGAGAWTSIFSAPPSFANGSNERTEGTLTSTPLPLNDGDHLRFNWDTTNGIAGVVFQLVMESR